MIICITGTSTDVGKTIVTAALASAFAAAGRSVTVIKPAQTGALPGEPGDIATIERLSGIRGAEFARYPDPLAPDTAAARAAMPPLLLDDVAAQIRHHALTSDVTLVEGAGGLLVGLGQMGANAGPARSFTLADLAQTLGARVLLVAAAGLGTLNHSALTTAYLERAGLDCLGLVIGAWPEHPDLAAQCNLDDLPRVTGVPIVGRVPAGVGAWTRAEFTAAAPSWFDPDLVGMPPR